MARPSADIQQPDGRLGANGSTDNGSQGRKSACWPSHDWKRLLEDAGVRDGRLHDARHTAGTVLMLLGVPDRVIDQIMGWEPGGAARMRARYLHVPDELLKDVARKIGAAIWGSPETPLVDKDQDNEG